MDGNNETHTKEQKYSYLNQSFQKGLQRSYEREKNNYRHLSPPQLRSPEQKYQRSSQRRSPRRSSEFSPYQDREQNMRERLVMHELKNHNRILSEQIAEYKIMVDKLQAQLRNKTDQFIGLDKIRQKEKVFYESTVAEMKEQIKALLTKNTYLEQRAIVLDKQMRQFEEQFTRVEARNRSMSVSMNTNKNQSSKLITELQNILNGNEEHNNNKVGRKQSRDAGKLLNHSFSLNNSYNPSPKNTKTGQRGGDDYILGQVQNLMKKIHKYQQFTQSIIEMHHKITGKALKNEHELKVLWKWLKDLGHHYNITQKWKKMLMDLIGLSQTNRPEDLGIDEVLQQTVIQWHKK